MITNHFMDCWIDSNDVVKKDKFIREVYADFLSQILRGLRENLKVNKKYFAIILNLLRNFAYGWFSNCLWYLHCGQNMSNFKFKDWLGYLNTFALDCTFGHQIFWLSTFFKKISPKIVENSKHLRYIFWVNFRHCAFDVFYIPLSI